MPQISKTKKKDVMKRLEESLLSGEKKSYREYSRELNTHKDTIKKYIEEIIENTPRKSLKEVEFRLEVMYDKIIKQAEELLESAVEFEEREKAIKLLIHCHEKFIDFLERFGIKAKAPDLHYVKGDMDNNINIQVFSTEEEKE